MDILPRTDEILLKVYELSNKTPEESVKGDLLFMELGKGGQFIVDRYMIE